MSGTSAVDGGQQPCRCAQPRIQAQGDEWFDRHRKEMRRGTTMRLIPRRAAGVETGE